jgi:hypothetical protein
MKLVREKALTFAFSDEMAVVKFDAWPAFRTWANRGGRRKGVDIVAHHGRTIWFVEVKDFRVQEKSPRPPNSVQLAKTVDLKVRGSMAGLEHVSSIAGDSQDQQFAAGAVAARRRRVALHVEPPIHGSRLFPSAIQIANILQRLRQLVKDVDPTPLVLQIRTTPDFGVPWTVRSSV